MQVNAQTLQGRWNEILGHIRKRWGDINGDELQAARGDADQLVGAIQRQTGESREAIEEFLDKVSQQGSSMLDQVKQTVQDFTRTAGRQTKQAASSVASQAQSAAQVAAEQASATYHRAESVVQQRPMESILACFGVGLITGIAISMMMRSR